MSRVFSFSGLPAHVRFGEEAVPAVAEELDRLGSTQAVLVAGRNHTALGQAIQARLGSRIVASFGRVRPHVPRELADEATYFFAKQKGDALVAIGGGSAIGLGKAIAIDREVPLVAVPTTYAGSEMTSIWGLTTAQGKTTGEDPAALPRAVVYDPRLLRSLPRPMAAASGLNAVAHAVEALYAPRANPVSDLLAHESLRRLISALPSVVANAADDEAGADALYGACLAAMALAQAGTSFHHKICHVLGGAYDMPHAETHAALLPHSVRLAVSTFPAIVPGLAAALGTDDPAGVIADLTARIGAPTSLRALGLPQATEDAVADAANSLTEAGIPVDKDAVAGLLQDAA